MGKDEVKFLARVDKTPGHGPNGDCHLWTGAKGTGQYGRLGRVPATHFALLLAGYPRPSGLFALHSCDNPPCVNPDHLRWGTPEMNTQDMLDRKRSPNRNKTHCPMGHPYDKENTLITRARPGYKYHSRVCKACHYGRKAVKLAAKRENIAQRARNMLADQFSDDPVMAEKIRAGTCRNEDLNRAVKAVELAITLKKPHPTKALQAVLGEMDEP
jgi:hypothetical protein